MSDEFNSSTNWCDWSRFDCCAGGSSSSPTTSSGLTSFGRFPWPTETRDVKGRSSMESVSALDNSGVDLHMMGLNLSTEAMDWNQALLCGDKVENSFPSTLQENLSSSSNYQQESGNESCHVHWREQIIRGVLLDQPQFSPHGSSCSSATTATMYGSPSMLFQGLLGPDNQAQHPSFHRPMSYHYGGTYGNIGTGDHLLPSWSKVPQFFCNSHPKQTPHNQLHFSNNATFWNASENTTNHVHPSFFPSLQPQFPTSNFEEKTRNISEARDSNSVANKSGSETSTKRPRNETASGPLPAFKVRKEKMGDRISALQQLVSPFGKTDTASVLSEAFDYIKFLHDHFNILSTPYVKSGDPTPHEQSSDKLKDLKGRKQDLRSRGLCLVPVSSTFPMTHETTVDFWNPTFG